MFKILQLVSFCGLVQNALATSAALEARRAVRQAALLQQQQQLGESKKADEAPVNSSACVECRRLQEEAQPTVTENVQAAVQHFVANKEAAAVEEERRRIAALPVLVRAAQEEALKERQRRYDLESQLNQSWTRAKAESSNDDTILDSIRSNITRQRLVMRAGAAEEARLIAVADKAVKDAKAEVKDEVDCEEEAAKQMQAVLEKAAETGRQEQRAADAAEVANVTANVTLLKAKLALSKLKAEVAEAQVKSLRDARDTEERSKEEEAEKRKEIDAFKSKARADALEEARAMEAQPAPAPAAACNCNTVPVPAPACSCNTVPAAACNCNTAPAPAAALQQQEVTVDAEGATQPCAC